MKASPILFKLSADLSEREAYQMFKDGLIDAREYSRVRIEARTLNRIADLQMALLAPQKRVRGYSYSDRKF